MTILHIAPCAFPDPKQVLHPEPQALADAPAAMQLKEDDVSATGHVGNQPLNVPKNFRGNAHVVLPLVQAEASSSGPIDRCGFFF